MRYTFPALTICEFVICECVWMINLNLWNLNLQNWKFNFDDWSKIKLSNGSPRWRKTGSERKPVKFQPCEVTMASMLQSPLVTASRHRANTDPAIAMKEIGNDEIRKQHTRSLVSMMFPRVPSGSHLIRHYACGCQFKWLKLIELSCEIANPMLPDCGFPIIRLTVFHLNISIATG